MNVVTLSPAGSRKPPYLIGIDAGGTTIRVLLADCGGHPVAEARTPADPGGGAEPLYDLIPTLLQKAEIAAREICAVCAGIAKISRTGIAAGWENELRRQFPGVVPFVVADFVTAFQGATGGFGIAAVAGTGSVIYGRDANDGTIRVGGRGWEYGDEGSGAWLTTEAIRRTLRSLDGLETPSSLTRAVAGYFQTGDAALLAEAARQKSREAGRGFLIPFLQSLAQGGDTEAVNLFVGAAGWLASQTRAAVRQLNFAPDQPLPVAMVGGLWEVGDLLRAPFERTLTRWLPHATVIVPRARPVEGAVALALTNAPRTP